MKPGRHMKHTDLFIVRIWTQDADDGYGDANNTADWRGKIQRVVDGEAHEFRDWDSLVNTLRAMLSSDSPEPRADGAQTCFTRPEYKGEEG